MEPEVTVLQIHPIPPHWYHHFMGAADIVEAVLDEGDTDGTGMEVASELAVIMKDRERDCA